MIYYSYVNNRLFSIKVLEEINDRCKVEAIKNDLHDSGVVLTLLFLKRFNLISELLVLNRIQSEKELTNMIMKPIPIGFKFYLNKKYLSKNFIEHFIEDHINIYDELKRLFVE